MSSHLDFNIGQIPFQDQKWPSGVAYICIHSDIDRDIFISDCFSKSTVSIKTQEGSVYKNCPIDPSKFNDIIWPENAKDIGSPIVYVTEPIHQQPIVIATLNFIDTVHDQDENQFKLRRKWNNSIVEIAGSAKDGYLNIIVDGIERSDFTVRVSNKDNNANLTLDVDGQVNILAHDTVTISSQQEIITQVGIEDEISQSSQSSTEVNHMVNKFSVNEGSEPIPLGETLKNLLNEILDTVASATVTTQSGPTPLNNAMKISALKAKTDAILSKISFTD